MMKVAQTEQASAGVESGLVMKTLQLLSFSVVMGGCAGTITGPVDGQDIPPFGSASFGLADSGSSAAVLAYATPRSSCELGSDLETARVDRANAGSPEAVDEVNGEAADAVNSVLEVGEWSAFLVAFAGDDNDFIAAESEFEVSEGDLVASLRLCRLDTAATVDDDGQTCFSAASGDFSLSVSDDGKALHLRSSGGVTFDDADGSPEGVAEIDLTFGACNGLRDAADFTAGS